MLGSELIHFGMGWNEMNKASRALSFYIIKD